MNNPRIIAGKYKSFRLKVPNDIRPITDRVKTVLFDILGNMGTYSSVLDGFSGSGSLGLEALSRGAETVTFVDDSQDSISALKENIIKLKLEKESYQIIALPMRKFLKEHQSKYDLILLDPPFSLTATIRLDDFIAMMDNESLLVVKIPTHESAELKRPRELGLIRSEVIGDNTLNFYQPSLGDK